MRSYVINLAAEAERWLAVQRQFSALGLAAQRVEAVDGRRLAPRDCAALCPPALNQALYHRPLDRGEIGCYASHLAVWRALLAGGEPFAAVFEDDVEVDAALPRVLDALARLPRRWHMVKLIGRAHEKVAGTVALGGAHRLVSYRRVPSLTCAYVVSREGAERLLARRPPFGRPIDVDLRHWWECGIGVLGVLPYPVREGAAALDSSIAGRESPHDLAGRLHKLALQARYTWGNARARRQGRGVDAQGLPPVVPEVGLR